MANWSESALGLKRGSFDWGRTLLMAVLNTTPDSFSDGGAHLGVEAAIAHGRALDAAGADVIDVGGESTRPGAAAVSVTEELARTTAGVAALAATGTVSVSIDTTKAAVARAALEVGALVVNDISGGLFDPEILDVVAAHDAVYIVGHTRGRPADMARHAEYGDVVDEVKRELAARIAEARRRGVRKLLVDPGLGFAKRPEHDWAILAGLPRFADLGVPLVIGASRKSFLGKLTGHSVDDRDRATAAVTVAAILGGAVMVRVHDLASQKDAVRVADAIVAARGRERG